MADYKKKPLEDLEGSSIQYEYYKKIRTSIQDIEGRTSKDLSKYMSVYNKELSDYSFRTVKSTVFFKKIQDSKIVLIGDFHAQSQSSRSYLRLCRHFNKIKKKSLVLLLECFQETDQLLLNSYLAQKISDQEFLKKIEWSKNWSFPWSNTKPILKWAILNNIPVYGINKIKTNIKLKERDQFFAEKIKKIQTLHQDKMLLVQVGDFHLAEGHLPRQLKKNKMNDFCKIFQSPDSIYFKSLIKSKNIYSHKTGDFYQLNESTWALMTVLPWVKWQDYLLHLESSLDCSLSDIDFTDHVDRFVSFVTSIMQKKVNHEKLSVYWAFDAQLTKKLNSMTTAIDSVVKKTVKDKIKLGQSFFIPELQLGVLSRLTVNHLSKIAAQYILYELGIYKKTIPHSKKYFLEMIWFEATVYFLSKLTNPKKKSDTISDLKSALKSVPSSDLGKEALILSLNQKMKELRYASYGQISSLPHRRTFQNQSYMSASQLLGGMLGEKIFSAFQKKIIKFPEMNSFLFRKVDDPHFEKIYYELIEIIDSWPLPFQSKYDKF